MPKLCKKCQNVIPRNIVVDGKNRNLQSRKYCLACSPFQMHNTLQLHCKTVANMHSRKYKLLIPTEKQKLNEIAYAYQKDRRSSRKKELIAKMGGSCQICGYSKNLSALMFHHLDPQTKCFELNAYTIGSKSMKTIEKEAEKCQLLCVRCHTEIHFPHFDNWNDTQQN